MEEIGEQAALNTENCCSLFFGSTPQLQNMHTHRQISQRTKNFIEKLNKYDEQNVCCFFIAIQNSAYPFLPTEVSTLLLGWLAC